MLENSTRLPNARLAGSLLLGGLAAALISLPIASAMLAAAPPPTDPCAIALDVGSLAAADRAIVARHLLACSDVSHGRITPTEYRARLASLDTAWTRPVSTAPIATQWASTVRGMSTEYSAGSWSATKVLGAPDVFPNHGDHANAWASRGADDRDEWIEVGYAQPMQVGAVELYETYNPGAVTAIELITVTGQRIAAYQAAPGATSAGVAHKLRAEVGCTTESIVAVHVRLASTAVAGWNELDAIGLVPCAAGATAATPTDAMTSIPVR